MLKAGTYNDVVRENLPPQHRTGTIRRRDFWNVWPDARVDFFKDISPADVAEFIETAGTRDCRISMRTARRRSMLGSTIETGAADIRGRFAAAETPRMSICG